MKHLTILLVLCPIFSYGQSDSINKNAFYVRAGIYEVSIGYQHKFNKIGVGFEADYRPTFKHESYNNSFPSLSLAASMQAIRAKSLLNIYFKKNNFLSVMFFYRQGNANNIIYDPGKFGGSNHSDYAEYSERNNEIGLGAFMHKAFNNHPAIQFYFGASIAYKEANQHYTVDGTYANQIPVDYTLVKNWVVPGLYVGFKFDIIRF